MDALYQLSNNVLGGFGGGLKSMKLYGPWHMYAHGPHAMSGTAQQIALRSQMFEEYFKHGLSDRSMTVGCIYFLIY